MSRTFSHVPERVQILAADPTILGISHRHWVPGRGRVSCPDPDARCTPRLPRWASTQRYSRRGTIVLERRSAVRDALRQAATIHRAECDLDDLEIPRPERFGLA